MHVSSKEARVLHATTSMFLRAHRLLMLFNRRPLYLRSPFPSTDRLLVGTDDRMRLLSKWALRVVLPSVIRRPIMWIATIEQVLAQLVILLEMATLIVIKLGHVAG